MVLPFGNYQDFMLGGLHPVELGDRFDNGRYTVERKLGHGSTSTVWLAHDLQEQRYVALKIYRADLPTDVDGEVPDLAFLRHLHRYPRKQENPPLWSHFPMVLDTFLVHGPNGVHVCHVMEVLGGPLDDMIPGIAPGPRPPPYQVGMELKLL